LMVSHFYTNRFDSAVYYSDKTISLGSVKADAIPEAMLLKAKALQKSNRNNDAEDVLMTLINEYKTIHGAEGLFLLAESYHLKGKFDQSNDAIFDFSEPFSAHGYWYGRSFVLLAENYIKLGEEFQAKATLESVIERSGNEEIRALARERLAKLK
jgi:tetratricopeptide (TPR) repeat protein